MDILENKSYKTYNRLSRYSVFPYYYHRDDEKFIYGTTAHLKNEGITYVSHRVDHGDTLDSLALYYYNNPTYFWIIADFNRIQDPYEDLAVGSLIKIPTFSAIYYDM